MTTAKEYLRGIRRLDAIINWRIKMIIVGSADKQLIGVKNERD